MKPTYEELEAQAAAMRKVIDEILHGSYTTCGELHEICNKALSGDAGRDLLGQLEASEEKYRQAEALIQWQKEQMKKLENALKWVSQQPCTHEYHSELKCADTDACITEYCLPCYARQALAALDGDPK